MTRVRDLERERELDIINITYMLCFVLNKIISPLTEEELREREIKSYMPVQILFLDINYELKSFLFFKKYPKVERGDKITLISYPKTDKINKERKPLDWDKLSSKIVAFITVFVLVQQLAK